MELNLNKKKILIGISVGLLLVLLSFPFLVFLYKDRIIAAAVSEINKHVDSKIEVDPVIELSLLEKWPQISVKFKKVIISEKASVNPGKLAQLESIYLSFNLWDVIGENFTISQLYLEKGFIRLRVNEYGQKNFDIIKEDTVVTARSFSLKLDRVILKEVNVVYDNRPGDQLHEIFFHEAKAYFHANKDDYKIGITAKAKVLGIVFGRDIYFKNKDIECETELEHQGNKDIFTIFPSLLKIESGEFKVAGTFIFKDKKFIDLSIEENNASIQTILSIIPDRFYAKFQEYKSSGKIYCNAKIKGQISNKIMPLVEVKFGCQAASIYHPDIKKKIDEITFSGLYTNGSKQNAQTSILKIAGLKCIMDKKSFSGALNFQNFSDPHLTCQVKGSIDAAFVFQFVKVPMIKMAEGGIDFNVDIDGKLKDLLDKRKAEGVSAMGELTLINFKIESTNLDYPIRNVNGEFIFNNNDVSFSNLNFLYGNSDFKCDGILKNVFRKLLFGKDEIYADITIDSKYIDLDELLNSQKVEVLNESQSGRQKVKDTELKNTFPFDFSLEFRSKSIKTKNILSKNVSGQVNASWPHLNFKDVSMSVFGGRTESNGYVRFTDNGINTMLIIEMDHIESDSLFYKFQNFDQDFITYKNLKGNISGSIQSEFLLDNNNTINKQSLKVTADLTVKDGRLMDFEPLKQLSRFIEEKKLENIEFSELKNKIFIDHETITIPEMDIQSSASNLKVSGTQQFDGLMDYHITIPLENFKKRKKDTDEVYGAIEEDQKGKSNVFLTLKGTPENFKISYDTKKAKNKIKADLEKEGKELKSLFKRKREQDAPAKESKEDAPGDSEYFNFDQ